LSLLPPHSRLRRHPARRKSEAEMSDIDQVYARYADDPRIKVFRVLGGMLANAQDVLIESGFAIIPHLGVGHENPAAVAVLDARMGDANKVSEAVVEAMKIVAQMLRDDDDLPADARAAIEGLLASD
jgi:hypothetical protein